jgi:hypothetical protein
LKETEKQLSKTFKTKISEQGLVKNLRLRKVKSKEIAFSALIDSMLNYKNDIQE